MLGTVMFKNTLVSAIVDQRKENYISIAYIQAVISIQIQNNRLQMLKPVG